MRKVLSMGVIMQNKATKNCRTKVLTRQVEHKNLIFELLIRIMGFVKFYKACKDPVQNV